MRRLVFIILVLGGVLQVAPAGAQAGEPETSITCDGTGAHTARLYRTLFGRQADRDGLAYWVGLRRAGLTGEEVAYWMTQGLEYRLLYEGLDDEQFVDAVYRNLLGREADAGGRAYWTALVGTRGRHSVASWMTQTPEFAQRWPIHVTDTCRKAQRLGFSELAPGITLGANANTVVVLADRELVRFDAVDGGRTHAGRIEGDVVVNANWFIGGTSQSPVVSDGRVSGSADRLDRGQIVEYQNGCGGHTGELEHIWMGELYTPDDCVRSAVSGVSIVHKGKRSDAYPGIDLTYGYTNISRSHSFIGFNEGEIVVIATRNMNSSQLADYALSLGVVEGVMLDGGGSTQISTELAGFGSSRRVPSFAVLNSIAG